MTLDIHLDMLKAVANNLEQRFLSPVYLVGSFQRKYRDALDIDIVMIVTEERMKRLIGEDHVIYNTRRFEFNRKQKLYFEQHIHDFDIDFKIQTQKEAEAHQGPRTKLGRWVAMPE